MEFINGILHVTATEPAIALKLGPLLIRWYSLAYLAGILLGWWYLTWLVRQPYAPMNRAQADDFILYATLGVVLGGRVGHILFYGFDAYMQNPIQILKIWEGGMSFHGGVLGMSLAITLFVRRHRLSWFRVHDYIGMVTPIGLFTGRLANFVNGELWGKPTDAPWGVVFATGGPLPRHPSQLYEAFLEGPLLLLILLLIWMNPKLRQRPGLLTGVFLVCYGTARFMVEFVREPDAHLVAFAEQTGLHMGQWLCIPMVVLGLVFAYLSTRNAAKPA